MSVYKRPDGVFEADIRFRGMRRLKVSLHTTRKADAEPLHAALIALVREQDESLVTLVRDGTVTVETVATCLRERRPFASLRPSVQWPTVAEAAAAYVQSLREHPEREAATAKAALYQLARFSARFGDCRLDAVSLTEAEAWQGGVVAGMAVNSARAYVARVVALYAWHQRQEARQARAEERTPRPLYCPLNPETRPTRTTRRQRYLLHGEAARLIVATPDVLVGPVACGLLAGLRIDEVCHLRPGVDIDLTRDMLIVQARGEPGDPDYWTPKGGKRREVPITADLKPILVHHLLRYGSSAYVFPASTDPTRPLAPSWLRQIFAPVVERAGLIYGRTPVEGVVFHTLRHTFASWLVAADVNPYRVAKLLGNSLAMVETTYGHLAPTDNRAAVALLSGAVPFPQLAEAA